MALVKTSAKGQVVIPAKIREEIGLKPGGKVLVTSAGNKAIIEAVPENPIEATCGMLQGGPSLTKALVEDRREELEREEKKFARLLRTARLPQQRRRIRKG